MEMEDSSQLFFNTAKSAWLTQMCLLLHKLGIAPYSIPSHDRIRLPHYNIKNLVNLATRNNPSHDTNH